MSVVVGFRTDTQVCLGSDSLISNGEFVWEGAAKIWNSGKILYGAVGDLAATTAVRFSVVWPDAIEPTLDPRAWVYQHISTQIADLSIEGDWEIMIGLPQGLVTLDSDGAISFHSSGVASIGAGSSFSLGCMQAYVGTFPTGYLPETKDDMIFLLEKAIQAACDLSPSCGGSIYTMHTKSGK